MSPIWKARIPFFVVAGVCLLAGVAGFVYFLITGIYGMTEALKSWEAPGEISIQAEQKGTCTIFVETPVVREQTVMLPQQYLPGLRVDVTGPDGKPVLVKATRVAQNYNIGGRQGYAVMEFEAAGPGTYRIVGSFPNGDPPGPVPLAVSQGFVGDLVRLIATSMVVMFGSLLVAGVLILVAFLRKPRVN